MKNRNLILMILLLSFFFAGNCGKDTKKPLVETEEPFKENMMIDESVLLYVPSGGRVIPVESIFQYAPEDENEEKIKMVLLRLLKGDEELKTVFSASSDVQDVFISRENIAYVDLNKAVLAGNPGGILSEIEFVESIATTVLKNFPEIEGVMILIDGRELKTLAGHLDISKPFRLSGEPSNTQGAM